jgi:hypothetical protein
VPDAQDLGFVMLPPDDEGVEPVADLDAAAASALEASGADQITVEDDPPVPFGRTWLFDFQAGRTVRQGIAPAETRGIGALRMRCLMAVYSARYAHAVFSDAFGMEHPEEPVGRLLNDEVVAEYGERLKEALLRVDPRIVAVDNFEATYDPVRGVLEIENVEVVTDDEDRIPLENMSIRVEV